ncbi:DUF4173 domain-containing protein [Octadecabacter sp. CECT 8868]|uniref:DUF4153 domain-containing protein n=1 Tax=Octadecabacter algicola TaxID=2909342 RepID=UPI001F20B42B|nr:DUF4173 domain-containing protein [Octadecabacter algicola]MCF2903855.1 DUF4173 domain-containing protein [Octadecabacter algicola]
MTKTLSGPNVPQTATEIEGHETNRVNPPIDTQNPCRSNFDVSGIFGFVLLVAFADFLFWGYKPGATLGLFAIAVFMAAAVRHGSLDGLAKPALLMGFSTLPVLEHVQALSVSILLIGGVCSLAWLSVGQKDAPEWIAAAVLKLIAFIPLAGLNASIASVQRLRAMWNTNAHSAASGSTIFWRNWSLPLGGTLVLGSLLLNANPVLERFVLQLFQFDLDLVKTIQRILLWSGVGLVVWPLLNAPKPSAPRSIALPITGHQFGLNGGSVLRALIVFNGFLTIQTTLDFSILLGNASLPEGMSYATYAHRGAYPLMVTAILAGGFAIAAHPFLKEHAALRPLLILWVGQNVILTSTAAMRLNLYIAEYGLTYLRTYALIWMALIAIGLTTVLWHVFRERAATVLVLRLMALGIGALYFCAFVNFAGIIATDALKRAGNAEGAVSVDWEYLCDLGQTAANAIAKGLAANPLIVAPTDLQSCLGQGGGPSNWRELDFRSARMQGDLWDE